MIDIKKYEAMAKLDLSETERQWVSDAAAKLLDSFSALETINTDGVKPLVTVLDIKNVFREDIARKMITREELLSAAPLNNGEYFEVPKTVE
jgi:aspartyl-tRNA(Asn)/glutamyl-tRNA(Gln) amidotransferase subunit C